MMDITSEQYKKYREVLDWKIYSFVDKRLITNYYIITLGKYLKKGTYDIDELNLIIDAFCYFFDLKLSLDEQTFDGQKIKDMALAALKKGSCAPETSDAKIITVLLFEIAKKIINKTEEEKELSKKCNVLYKLALTIEPVEKYEREHGNIKDVVKSIKKYLN